MLKDDLFYSPKPIPLLELFIYNTHCVTQKSMLLMYTHNVYTKIGVTLNESITSCQACVSDFVRDVYHVIYDSMKLS